MMFNHDKCKEEKQEILKTFESTILKVLESVEKTNNKFMEQCAKIQMEHFKQLDKHSANWMGAMGEQLEQFVDLLKKPEPVVERLTGDFAPVENVIEKEDNTENPLEEISNIPIKEGIQIQFEGEEEIMPVNIVT